MDPFDHGLTGTLRYRAMVEGFADQLEAGRRRLADDVALAPWAEEELIASLATSIAAALSSGQEALLPARVPELIELVLTPYLGPTEAGRVARRDLRD